MKLKKIYCNECENIERLSYADLRFGTIHTEFSRCFAKNNLIDTQIRKNAGFKQTCEEKNKNNDCHDYKYKWQHYHKPKKQTLKKWWRLWQ